MPTARFFFAELESVHTFAFGIPTDVSDYVFKFSANVQEAEIAETSNCAIFWTTASGSTRAIWCTASTLVRSSVDGHKFVELSERLGARETFDIKGHKGVGGRKSYEKFGMVLCEQ